MADPIWLKLKAVSPHALSQARVQMHRAVQWPSRAARAALPARADDSHANLGWDAGSGMLVSHPFCDGNLMGLSIIDGMLVHLKDGVELDRYPLFGGAPDDAREWMASRLVSIGVDPAPLHADLPYELPAEVRDAEFSLPPTDQAARDALCAWFANAAAMLEEIVANEPAASAVRCWPHHFDIATLVTISGEGENATTVGVGMSPGDGSYADPYLYVTPWPYPHTRQLPELPALGHWHTEGFVAAIATAERIIAASDQAGAVGEFLRDAIAGSRDLLAG